MILKEKKIILKDGTEAILKTPAIDDAETMLENIRICSGETDFLSMYPEDWEEATVESEAKWIKHHREDDNALLIACFIDGKAVGSSDISFMSGIKTSHRAVLGITVQKKYWNIGIGSAMFEVLMKEAEENEKTEIVELEFVEGNDRAKALYEKFGLKVVSMKPKAFRGSKTEHIRMSDICRNIFKKISLKRGRTMNHCGTKMLETDRLVLRRYTADDARAMFENWANDEKVTEFLMWKPHTSPTETEQILQDWIKHYSEDNYYNWAIVLKETADEPIGNIAVVNSNEKTGMMHIGYCIGRKWWHKGITTEALKAVMDFLFDEVNANRIESRHDPRNPHSGGVMKKCGMKYEGTLRSSDWNNRGICDACYYALLKSDR